MEVGWAPTSEGPLEAQRGEGAGQEGREGEEGKGRKDAADQGEAEPDRQLAGCGLGLEAALATSLDGELLERGADGHAVALERDEDRRDWLHRGAEMDGQRVEGVDQPLSSAGPAVDLGEGDSERCRGRVGQRGDRLACRLTRADGQRQQVDGVGEVAHDLAVVAAPGPPPSEAAPSLAMARRPRRRSGRRSGPSARRPGVVPLDACAGTPHSSRRILGTGAWWMARIVGSAP